MISPDAIFNDVGQQLIDEYGIHPDRVPRDFNAAFRLHPSGIIERTLGLHMHLKEIDQRMILLDPFTLYYPYLGESNYAHELAHFESPEEKYPHEVEEAVLLAARSLEPESEHALIDSLLNFVRIQMRAD